MSQATHPHPMDAVPAVPAVPERAEVRRARFTVLDETGRSPYETDSHWPKFALAAIGVGVLAVGAFFMRGSGGAELKDTGAAPAAPVAAPVNDPSRTQAAWAKEHANLKPAALPVEKTAGSAAVGVSPAPSPQSAAPPVAAKAPSTQRSAVAPAPAQSNSHTVAPSQRARKASDNPYADPPAQRAAPSDNPY